MALLRTFLDSFLFDLYADPEDALEDGMLRDPRTQTIQVPP
jgi:hypothetical protein